MKKTQNAETVRATLLFVFNKDLSKVLLQKKLRPSFHAGMYNGLGGKNLVGESDPACATRELKEESGLAIAESQWRYYAHLKWLSWDVPVLVAHYQGDEVDAQSLDEGEVGWYLVGDLPEKCISNLRWLIPMAKDVLLGAVFEPVTIDYS